MDKWVPSNGPPTTLIQKLVERGIAAELEVDDIDELENNFKVDEVDREDVEDP